MRVFTPLDKYVHYHKENIYTCSAGFRKSFVSSWHNGFIYKLLNIDEGGNFSIVTLHFPEASERTKLDISRIQEVYIKGVF